MVHLSLEQKKRKQGEQLAHGGHPIGALAPEHHPRVMEKKQRRGWLTKGSTRPELCCLHPLLAFLVIVFFQQLPVSLLKKKSKNQTNIHIFHIKDAYKLHFYNSLLSMHCMALLIMGDRKLVWIFVDCSKL